MQVIAVAREQRMIEFADLTYKSPGGPTTGPISLDPTVAAHAVRDKRPGTETVTLRCERTPAVTGAVREHGWRMRDPTPVRH